MFNYYFLLLLVLFLFGIYNLVWRVKNDAVVYLNPALGSKASPVWLVFTAAGAGLLAGVFFSQEMLEIPRKVIFNPGVFVFSDFMVIFTAMMITDVILTYIFRVLNIRPSSIVMVLFEILGSSFAVSMVKIRNMRKLFSDLILFINPEQILNIIAGIFLSVIVAFLAGALIQYIVRLFFTFRYRELFRRYGGVYGAILITLVFYFIMINGAGISLLKNTPIGTFPLLSWIRHNFWFVLIISVLFWTIFLWAIRRFFRADILKTLILLGVFFLAVAMASNEMVSYFGVPVTLLQSFNEWIASGSEATLFKMDTLSQTMHLPYVILGLAGVILVGAFFWGKSVARDPESSLYPGSRNEEDEPSREVYMARTVTRFSLLVNHRLKTVIPSGLNRFVHSRFSPADHGAPADQQVFTTDKIRITVNFYVSVILIALATSLKLPVLTVYVVFMVMLGTSLADRAWGRESAVARISGVFALMGSWALTIIIAFTLSAFAAWIIVLGGRPVTGVMILITTLLIVRSEILRRRKARKISEDEELINEKDEIEKRIEKCNLQVVKTILSANKIFSFAFESFLKGDRNQMHQTLELREELNKKNRPLKNRIIQTVSSMNKMDLDSGYFYIQINDYLQEIAHSLNLLSEPLNEHLENQYRPLNNDQIEDMRHLVNEVDSFFNFALYIVKEEKFETIDEWVGRKADILDSLTLIEKGQINRIKNKEVDVRNSLLFFKALSEIKNLTAHSVSLIKSYRSFILVNRKSG